MRVLTISALIFFTFTTALAQDERLLLMSARLKGPSEPRLVPIALVENGLFKSPGGLNNKDATAFIKSHMPTGRKFSVVFGGAAAGTISILRVERGCNDRIFASGPFTPGSQGIGRIIGFEQSLAITSDRIARVAIWRRAPSARERALAAKMAKLIFSKNGVTTAQLAKMQTASLVGIDVDGDKRSELVGTFRLHSSDPERPPRYVFLIAEGRGTNYKTTFSTYRAFPNSKAFNIGEEALVDYLDLDRDGVAEIVTSYSNERASGYHIYRRTNGEWKVVYDYSNDYCSN